MTKESPTGWVGLGIKKKPGDDLLSRDSSTIGAEELNFRVRDGNGWDLFAMITRQLYSFAVRLKLLRRAWPAHCPRSNPRVSKIHSGSHYGQRLSKPVLATLGTNLVV